jgi:hypothetical protein
MICANLPYRTKGPIFIFLFFENSKGPISWPSLPPIQPTDSLYWTLLQLTFSWPSLPPVQPTGNLLLDAAPADPYRCDAILPPHKAMSSIPLRPAPMEHLLRVPRANVARGLESTSPNCRESE